MNSKKIAIFALAILLVGGALLYSLGTVQPQGEKLVLYNNFAYYEQNAKLSGNEVSFELPYGVETDSIKLRLVNGYVFSQHINAANYTNNNELLKSYVGKEVSVFDSQGKEIKGTLIRYDGRAYVKAGGTLYVITPSYFSLADFNGEVKDTNASIAFKLTGNGGDAKLSYLMDSISWTPDYTLYLNGNGGTISLYGIVSNSAKDYDNVSLSLFYGQVQRTRNSYYYPMYDYAKGANYETAEIGSASSPNYQSTQISEFYKYNLGSIALPKGESQFNIMEKNANSVKKTYEMYVGNSEDDSALAIMLAINNSVQNGLGTGLPSGSIRVMNADGFVGESAISETPKDSEMKFSIGNAFDVIGSSRLMNQTGTEIINCDPRVMDRSSDARICMDYRGRLSTYTYVYSATVKNKKSDSADVVLHYSPYGEWVITDENIQHAKVSQNNVEWRFNVPAGSEKTLTFTITLKSVYNPVYYAIDSKAMEGAYPDSVIQ